MDEVLSNGKEPTEEELQDFDELKISFQKGIDSIQGTNYDKLPLALLLLKVEEQEKNFKSIELLGHLRFVKEYVIFTLFYSKTLRFLLSCKFVFTHC